MPEFWGSDKNNKVKPKTTEAGKKGLLETWQIRGVLIGKFYEQKRFQTTSHRFRACETKKLKTKEIKSHTSGIKE
ncbi:hypothetical protein [Helicobacter pylori]|uniref:hypothetical protein n=1 Tax=Helicobacter pylori TaxID=210 RepID=UPI001E32E719|nr:hypothetical protein [Helicobacter pylori]